MTFYICIFIIYNVSLEGPTEYLLLKYCYHKSACELSFVLGELCCDLQ